MNTRSKLRGKAWVFGDVLDVDWEILPMGATRELHAKGIAITPEMLARYCMAGVDPSFPNKVQKGDFIVAGEGMGYGHDHDMACSAIKGTGVAAVLCESTNANFERNSIHHGVPLVVCKGIKKLVQEGDEIEVDLAGGRVKNLRTKAELGFTPLPGFLLDILDAGGLYPYLEQKVKAGKI